MDGRRGNSAIRRQGSEAEDQAALTQETESSDDLIDEAEVDIDDEDVNDQSTEDDDTDLDDEDEEIEEEPVDEEEALEALEIDDDHEVEIKVNGEVRLHRLPA